ncbi:hypothetical protein PPACK8108_LOCUS11710 [Phakopsora pachyrhizi]|uniref:Uncharacterized protein n=1 Tax=Phakopsora pachyrhizi TaxID=170000 RepID=A0AAV0B3J3_PHAPC|nr:hypothetical protein PPACK8108_LOCUS11709 [Phakopsora pachyrhizi]CAH7676559.1 hypothetical protein PPACK8108_LOCUS11710 [Phakopsora pachyrhizi]
MRLCGLCYQKFDPSLNKDKDLMLLIRAEVDSALRGSSLTTPGSKEQTVADEDSFITIRAVNKFESRSQGSHDASNWRAKFRSQHRAFLAKEINK